MPWNEHATAGEKALFTEMENRMFVEDAINSRYTGVEPGMLCFLDLADQPIVEDALGKDRCSAIQPDGNPCLAPATIHANSDVQGIDSYLDEPLPGDGDDDDDTLDNGVYSFPIRLTFCGDCYEKFRDWGKQVQECRDANREQRNKKLKMLHEMGDSPVETEPGF